MTEFETMQRTKMKHRVGMHGNYDVIVYSPQAQHFLIDNLDGIITRNHQKPAKRIHEKACEGEDRADHQRGI